MSSEITVILWRDIPAQVIASSGRKKVRAQLSPRFQEGIDAAAVQAGLGGSAEYLLEWRRASRSCGADLKAEADEEAVRLESTWTDEALRDAIRAGGVSQLGEVTTE